MSTTAQVIGGLGVRRFAQEQAAHRLARVAFEVRRLLDTAPNSDESVEAIHQFRVSTRRFRAVLDTFRRFFPNTERKAIREAIREAFAQAGEARNRDITAELISRSKAAVPDTLVPSILAERAVWDSRLRETLRTWNRDDFSARWREALGLP